jgi:hypothetical protein
MGTDDSEVTLSPSEMVVHEVAEQEGVPPEALDQPLYDAIDPDALDSLFRGETGQISFEYHGYDVTVAHSGTVSLESTDAD